MGMFDTEACEISGAFSQKTTAVSEISPLRFTYFLSFAACSSFFTAAMVRAV
jgi:hypothetical protein